MKKPISLLLSLALLFSCSVAVLALSGGSDAVAEPAAATSDDADAQPAAAPQPEAQPVYDDEPDVQPVYSTAPDAAPAAPSAADFIDVPADAWYYQALDTLVAMGGINGMTENTFCPDETMTVEQYIKTLVGCTFSPGAIAYYDTGDETARWSQKYIAAAWYWGALTGFELTEAHLTAPITRQEAAWLMVSFARCAGETVEAPEGVSRAISDYRSIPQTYREAVGAAYGAGMMTGYPDGSFAPEATLRRCEAAVTILRLLDPAQRVAVTIPDYVYDYAAPVPESDPVDDSFFSNAAFVGNSLCDGFAMYSGLTQGTFLGATSVTLFNVWDAGRQAVLESGDFDQVYVMLGINEIGQGTQAVAAAYDTFLQRLQTIQPQADIYVQALLPVCESMLSQSQLSFHITNAYIDELNVALQQVCEGRQVYFVNLHEAFADAAGALPASQCWDGVHLNVNSYAQWLDYLKTHTVQD